MSLFLHSLFHGFLQRSINANLLRPSRSQNALRLLLLNYFMKQHSP